MNDCERCLTRSQPMAGHHPTGSCPCCGKYLDPWLRVNLCPPCHVQEHRARTIRRLGDRPSEADPAYVRSGRARLSLDLGLPGATAQTRRALELLAATPAWLPTGQQVSDAA